MQKIMFNDDYGLTRAAIAGTKPMTRRLCKDSATGEVILAKDVASVRLYPDPIAEFVMKNGDVRCSVPKYQVGEVVAIAQSYKDVLEEMIKAKGGYGEEENEFFELYKDTPGWKNKMFVKADLMLNFIQFTDLKAERLRDISEEDCLKEGIIPKKLDYTPAGYPKGLTYYGFDGWGVVSDHAKDAFSAIIDKVSGRGTWESNPWVFAYSFELVK